MGMDEGEDSKNYLFEILKLNIFNMVKGP